MVTNAVPWAVSKRLEGHWMPLVPLLGTPSLRVKDLRLREILGVPLNGKSWDCNQNVLGYDQIGARDSVIGRCPSFQTGSWRILAQGFCTKVMLLPLIN